MDIGKDLLGGPPPTLLPLDSEVVAAFAAGDSHEGAAARFPSSSLAWAAMSDEAWANGRVIELKALGRAAAAINETEESVRIEAFLTDCDPSIPRD